MIKLLIITISLFLITNQTKDLLSTGNDETCNFFRNISQLGSYCDDLTCAPRVTFCSMVVGRCKCTRHEDLNSECNEACLKCLGDYLTPCCTCIENDFCYKIDQTTDKTLYQGQLPKNKPNGMFDAITDGDDPGAPFTPFTFYWPNMTGVEQRKCNIAYSIQCMSLSLCGRFCHILGASDYLWFKNSGCCECIGHSCPIDGWSKNKCKACKGKKTKKYKKDNQDKKNQDNKKKTKNIKKKKKTTEEKNF